jgi:hypothetical protein
VQLVVFGVFLVASDKYKEQYKAIFGEEYKEDKYRFKPHNFSSGRKAAGKSVCSICGLVSLNNDFSR